MEITNPRILVRVLCATIEASDMDGARELLANGCPVEHPEVDKNPLLLALESGRADVVRALMGAGATLPEDRLHQGLRFAIQNGITPVLDHAIESGGIGGSNGLLFAAATEPHALKFALHLLEMGADPAYREHGVTVFERAAKHGRTQLVDAIVARLTQEQKDELLFKLVPGDDEGFVSILIDAGADVTQSRYGLTLLEVARWESIKRVLRSAHSRASIEDAMGDHDAPEDVPAPSTKSSFTL